MDPSFRKQADVLVAATVALNEAVHQLRKQRKLSELSTNLIEIHRQENIGDENNHAAVSRLYEGDVPTLEVMKWKEMFDRVGKSHRPVLRTWANVLETQSCSSTV